MNFRKGLAPFWLGLGLAVLISSTPASAQLNGRRGPRQPGQGRRPFATADTPKQTERIRTFDVLHIKGEITLDTKKSEIRGTVTHTIASLYPGMNTLSLDCASELKVSKVTVSGKDKTPVDCKFEHKNDKLAITLDRPYKPEETFDVAITYSGSPKQGIYFIAPNDEIPGQPICVWTQGESEETRHWLPCYDHPNDRATSEMIVTVPKPMTVLSNGMLVDTKDNKDGTSTFHWKMDVPHSSYLISLAASEFNIVHDKAGELPVDYYVLKTIDEATARRAMGETPRMIDFFAEKLGQPYPYAKYAQVIVPEFTNGGMENISATTLNEYIIGDEISYLEMESDSLIAHELAHQWFGDLLTCTDWAHIWLNEGFATYFDALYEEFDKGEDAFRLKMESDQRSYKGMDRFVRRSIVETRYNDPDDLFESVTYSKGACVLNALRGLIGDDAWWRGIKSYVATHKLKMVETDDFKKAMEKASGKDLTLFFDQWVYHGGHPELKASWRYEPEDSTVRLKIEQTQEVDDLTLLFRLPTTVEMLDDSGAKSVPIVIDSKLHEFVIASPSKPKSVRIDPKGWWPKDLVFEHTPEEYLFMLDHAPDVLGRAEAARTLASKRKDDPKVIEALSKAWAREQDTGARVDMVHQVALLGEAAKPALIEAAKDKHARVRAVAFEALASKKADPALETLFRAAWSNPKEGYGVRRAAIRGLANWKVKDRDELLKAGLETKSFHDTLAVTSLELMLNDSSAKTRENAVLYSKPGRPAALRRAAIRALSRTAKTDKEVASAVVELVNDPIPTVRVTAWSVLAQNEVKSALPALEARLKVESAKGKPSLERAITMLKRPGSSPPRTPRAAPPTTLPSDSKAEITNLETQAAELELQVKELRNKAEALKLKDERAKLGPAKPSN